jgi:hypothetical protein
MSARSCGLVLGNTLLRLEREEPELEEVAEFVLGVAAHSMSIFTKTSGQKSSQVPSWAASFNRFGGEAERTSLAVLFEGWEGGTMGTGACEEETGRMGEDGLELLVSRLFFQGERKQNQQQDSTKQKNTCRRLPSRTLRCLLSN